MNPKRVSPDEVRRLMAAHDALLVATYDGDSFDRSSLDGAIPLRDFERRMPSLTKERELIFY